jgi:hypothetical protein
MVNKYCIEQCIFPYIFDILSLLIPNITYYSKKAIKTKTTSETIYHFPFNTSVNILFLNSLSWYWWGCGGTSGQFVHNGFFPVPPWQTLVQNFPIFMQLHDLD